jgi:hypothetical protein
MGLSESSTRRGNRSFNQRLDELLKQINEAVAA